MESGGAVEVPARVKESLTIDGYWERVSHFSLED